MNFPITFKEAVIHHHQEGELTFKNCQLIVTGNHLLIQKEPVRPDDRTKVVETEIYHLDNIEKYTTTNNLPEDKGLLND
jgi:hypothetical protein